MRNRFDRQLEEMNNEMEKINKRLEDDSKDIKKLLKAVKKLQRERIDNLEEDAHINAVEIEQIKKDLEEWKPIVEEQRKDTHKVKKLVKNHEDRIKILEDKNNANDEEESFIDPASKTTFDIANTTISFGSFAELEGKISKLEESLKSNDKDEALQNQFENMYKDIKALKKFANNIQSKHIPEQLSEHDSLIHQLIDDIAELNNLPIQDLEEKIKAVEDEVHAVKYHLCIEAEEAQLPKKPLSVL